MKKTLSYQALPVGEVAGAWEECVFLCVDLFSPKRVIGKWSVVAENTVLEVGFTSTEIEFTCTVVGFTRTVAGLTRPVVKDTEAVIGFTCTVAALT